jgi:long-chain acyl-CoA synthetase
MNLAAWVERNGTIYSRWTAIARGTEPLHTYCDLALSVRRLAGALVRRSRQGDRVVIAMANHPAFLEALFAIWHAGLVAVPVNAKLHRSEFAYIFENSGATLAIVDAKLAETLAGLSNLLVIDTAEWRAALAGPDVALAQTTPDDPAWLFYTSGTTGRPKGATLSHRNLLMMCMAYFADIEPVGPGHTMIHPAPLSHGSGLYSLAFVARGACNVVPASGGFSGSEVVELLSAHPNVSFFAAPTMVRRLIEHGEFAAIDKRNLRTIVYGGAPMHVADLERTLAVVGNDRLAQIYGQGESPMTITALAKPDYGQQGHRRWRERMGSVGTARTGIEVRVVDSDDNPLPPGEAGEIVCRGDVVMRGYWQNPAASEATLRGGWLHTGDIGAFDADGYLYLKDRSKDVIISAGLNIYPREVEEVLLRHPLVKEAAVVGRPHADRGEEVVAFVVARESANLPKAELDALCLDSIARFKRPRAYVFLDELPKNNYGKVLKTELRALLPIRTDAAS